MAARVEVRAVEWLIGGPSYGGMSKSFARRATASADGPPGGRGHSVGTIRSKLLMYCSTI